MCLVGQSGEMPQNRKIKSNINKKKSKRAAKTVLGGGVSCLARLHGGSMAAQRRDWRAKDGVREAGKRFNALGLGMAQLSRTNERHFWGTILPTSRMLTACLMLPTGRASRRRRCNNAGSGPANESPAQRDAKDEHPHDRLEHDAGRGQGP